MRAEIFYLFLAGFVSGIFFGSFFDFGLSLVVFLAALPAVLLFLQGSFTERKTIFTVSFFLFAVSLGLLRTGLEAYRYKNDLASQAGQKTVLRGIVAEFPDVRETGARLVVKEEKTAEKFLIITDIYPAVHYGDELELKGALRPVKNFSADGINFNYEKYLAKDGIFNEMIYPEISVKAVGSGNPIMEILFSVREKFSEKLRENVKEPEASLGLGMLIGEKHALPGSLLEVFKKSGVIHLVVLSGYNIALVSQFFAKIFSFLPAARSRFLKPIFYRAFGGGTAIILFVLMTGGGASAIRAAIMALIALSGTVLGRPHEAGRALFIAGFFMLLENPNILIFDPSFQLSFLATLGLIYLTPYIFSWLGKWRPAALRELLAQTLATQAAVLPLLIFLSGTISLVAVPANLLILPSVPFAMVGSFVTGALGFLGTAVALPFALVTSVLLSHAIFIAKFLAGLPFATVALGKTSLIFILSAYVIFFALVKLKK